jgi:hypothetical protein
MTAFRSVFDASLVENVPGLPEDSAHWWGPNTNFFSSRLGKNLYTVVGGVSVDPDDRDARFKDVSWDDEGDLEILKDKYKASPCNMIENHILTGLKELESRGESADRSHAFHSIPP